MKRRPSCWIRQCLIFPSALQTDGHGQRENVSHKAREIYIKKISNWAEKWWVKFVVMWLRLIFLPEGNGVGVVFTAFSHQESAVPGNTHQHVFSLNTGQTGVVPPENTQLFYNKLISPVSSLLFCCFLKENVRPIFAATDHSLSALVCVGLRYRAAQPHLELVAAQRCVSVVAYEAVEAVKHQVVRQVEAGGARLLTWMYPAVLDSTWAPGGGRNTLVCTL